MPQIPSGGGRMLPPTAPCPSVRMSIKAWRSRLSAIARRNSRLSKGGLARLMIRSRLLLSMTTSQCACSAWLLMSFNSGIPTQIRSSLPATKASMRVDPERGRRLAGERVPGAFDVGRGERPAVMPFDALPQAEGQRGTRLVPRPVAGEIGDDRAEAVLRYVLVEDDQVVEDSHQRDA